VIEIPGYIIKGDISLGATSSILLADQSSLDREVALKIMAAELVGDKAHTQRFMQVARTLASFSHPNIVAVYDVGTTEQQAPYYSMQYLSGGDFMTRAQQGMSEPDLTETLASIARAVGYIHQRGLVHRAIMPQNVLYDPYNTPVLIDFGVAPTPTQESFVTNTGFAVDVGRYMSPEQARGGEQDARSDIYSLGALTFLGLTGRPPYDGADGFAIAYAHVFEPIPRLPAARAHWQPLIDCALAKDPKDRYASIEEFLDALTNVGLERDVAMSVAPPAPPAAADAAPVAPAAAPVVARVPEAIVIPEREPPPSVVVPAKAVPKQSSAPAKVSASSSGLMRFWPLAVAALGLILIAAALLLPRSPPEPPMAPAPTTAGATPAPSAPVSPPSASTTADVAAKAADAAQPATTAADAGTPAVAAADAGKEAGQAAATGAGGLAAIDAAEAQLEADAADPAKAPTVVDPLPESIRLGRIDMAAQRLIAPPGKNALERFQFALNLDPRSRGAKQGIVDIAKKYIDLADKTGGDKAAGSAALAVYAEQLDHAGDVAKLVPEGADVMKDVAARRRKAAEPLLAQAKASADKWDKPAAKAAYEQALKIDPDNAAAREGVKFVATIGEPGFVFRDKVGDAGAPPMVVLPGAGIAMARHPVTRAEFRRFWDSGGRAEFSGKEPSCRDRESIFRSSRKRAWENPDIAQDDSHPVVCVGWAEAAAYALWLGKQTGHRYRLPTTAEFDQVASHAARGDCSTANLADAAFNKQFDSRDGGACDDGFAATAPVEHFAPVEGIYDIDGNVREWVAACGNGSAAGPGSSCRDFRLKGRGWLSSAKESATATDTYAADVSLNTVGFRVVRDMSN
jgi:formylglycine-generating enzyme required for sulfatase activity/tRNA A-37 threonylcarbamoyl transferase component Bud32